MTRQKWHSNYKDGKRISLITEFIYEYPILKRDIKVKECSTSALIFNSATSE